MTRRLLDRYEVGARTVSYHARSGPARERELLAHLEGGADLALVTDAGTPVVSDPGEGLVAAWAAAGGTVVPIPGASSVLAAVAGSGVAGPRWSFEGFLPRSGRERRERLARIAADERGHRPVRGARPARGDAARPGGGLRRRAPRRRLPRAHEAPRADRARVAGRAGGRCRPTARSRRAARSVIVVGWESGAPSAPTADSLAPPTVEEASARVASLVADGMPRAEAAKRVAAETGLDRRQLYRS